jgi:hypothetical protein
MVQNAPVEDSSIADDRLLSWAENPRRDSFAPECGEDA